MDCAELEMGVSHLEKRRRKQSMLAHSNYENSPNSERENGCDYWLNRRSYKNGSLHERKNALVFSTSREAAFVETRKCEVYLANVPWVLKKMGKKRQLAT
jgi:hypothetical protein